MNHKLLGKIVFTPFALLLCFLLAGCSTTSRATPETLPTVVLQGGAETTEVAAPRASGGVVASGIVAPAQSTGLVFTLPGMAETVLVTVGDTVQAGDPLVHLQGQEALQAAVSQAQFELVQALQALDDLKKEAETARVQAMQEIIHYEKAVRDTQYALDNFTVPANQAGLDTVEALNQMKQRLDAARLAFEQHKYRPVNDSIRKDTKEALDQAQADYNAAVRRLQYEYDLEVAQAKLSRALEDYQVFQAGADPNKERLAEARLNNAQTQLAATQAALERLTLVAPFDGTIAKVNVTPGGWVLPGQVVLTLADLSRLRIETTDLSERDVPGIAVGQVVSVFVKALGKEVSGYVSQISPLADTLGGDVVYKTIIELDELPSGIRAGMSVEVRFAAAP